MTENFTTDDELLAEMLIAEIPEPGPGYWSVIDELVDDADAHSSPDDQRELATATGPTALTDISIECRTGLDEPEPTFLRRLGWPAAIAASLILVIGLVAVVGNRRSANTNDLATDGGDSESALATGGPKMNLDHWHSVYGVWDCTLSNGAGDWLPHFDSWDDSSGIHSHDDGVIHIHPFYDWSAGENAQLGLFTTEMRVELSDDALVLEDGSQLGGGAPTCDGEPAVLHVRHWDFDFEAKQGADPEILTENLASARFENDREAWVIAYAPLDAELPMLPQERFDTIDNVTARVDYAPRADFPAPFDFSQPVEE